jgi:hypothetical protein
MNEYRTFDPDDCPKNPYASHRDNISRTLEAHPTPWIYIDEQEDGMTVYVAIEDARGHHVTLDKALVEMVNAYAANREREAQVKALVETAQNEQLSIDARQFIDKEAARHIGGVRVLSEACLLLGDDLVALLVAYYVWQSSVAKYDRQHPAGIP